MGIVEGGEGERALLVLQQNLGGGGVVRDGEVGKARGQKSSHQHIQNELYAI